MFSQTPDQDGYSRAFLKDDSNRSKNFPVHYLVLYTFLPNQENKKTVDHINRNRSDNRLENLRWATHKEQAENKTKYQGQSIKQITLSGEVIKIWDSVNHAVSTGKYSEKGIRAVLCKSHKNKTHAGFKWEYVKKEEIHLQLDGEIWKKIKNVEVSNKGRVKLNKSFRYPEGKIYYGTKLKSGYMVAPVNGRAQYRVHRLVAEAFLQNPENKKVVNHKDRNKSNNDVNNLEWVTTRENILHASSSRCKENVPRRRVELLDTNMKLIKEFPSIMAAADYFKCATTKITYYSRLSKLYDDRYYIKIPNTSDNLSHVPNNKKSWRKVSLRLLNTEDTKNFDSTKDASEYLGLTINRIRKYCKLDEVVQTRRHGKIHLKYV